jgi:hypothetical protein
MLGVRRAGVTVALGARDCSSDKGSEGFEKAQGCEVWLYRSRHDCSEQHRLAALGTLIRHRCQEDVSQSLSVAHAAEAGDLNKFAA